MKITKEILESTVKDIAKVVLPAVVDKDFNIDEKAPYELYNAIVGTVFDEVGYNKVVNDSPEFLYYHIPGGSKMTSDKKSLDITGDDKVDTEDVEAIDEILNKENITKEDIEKGDISGDFKIDTHDKELVEKEAERQKKSTIDVDTDSVYTAEEAAAYNLTLDGALQYGAIKTPAVEAVEAQPAIYSFASFGVDDDAAFGTGTVKVVSQDLIENATTIEVLTNEPAGNTTAEEATQFVGKQYIVQATELEDNKHYNLYSDSGLQTPIYVTVKLVSEAIEAVEAQDAIPYTNEEVDAYNAQLTGAKKAGDEK